MSADSEFLRFSADKLVQLAGRISTCLDKLTPEQVWSRQTDNENAIGNLVLHVCGNARQWIVSAVGGAPDARNRDAEFAARGGKTISDLKTHLEATAAEAEAVIRKLAESRLAGQVTVQGYTTSVLGAIYHVVEHFSGHTGQIIFATKLLTGEDLGFYKHLKKAAHSEKTP